MALYTVHLPPDGDIEKARFLRDGPSLFALLLPEIFLPVKRLWFAFAIYLMLVAAAILFAVETQKYGIALALILLPNLFLCASGRDLMRQKWAASGWKEAGVALAGSLAEAERVWFERKAREAGGSEGGVVRDGASAKGGDANGGDAGEERREPLIAPRPKVPRSTRRVSRVESINLFPE